MEAIGALVVVVLGPWPRLWHHVHSCIAPQGHIVLGAANVEEARRRRVRPDVIAVDGQILARCGWRARELAETIVPGQSVPLLGLVRNDAHRPPQGLDLTHAGIVALYEPFRAAELSIVVNWLARRGRAA